MIDEYEYDMQDTELLIGTSRVNLTSFVQVPIFPIQAE